MNKKCDGWERTHQGFQSIEIARRLKAVFPEGRIVAFVRSQPEMIASLYQQYVRVGGTRPPRRFLWPSDYSYADAKLPYPMPAFSFDHFDYDRLLSHYRSIFGAQRVHLYDYEEIRRDARAFLARFARDLGLDLEVERVALDKRNASYSLAVNRLGRLLNRFTAHNVSDKTYWVHVPYWYKLRKSLLEAANATGVLGERATPAQLLGPEVVANNRMNTDPALRALWGRLKSNESPVAKLASVPASAPGGLCGTLGNKFRVTKIVSHLESIMNKIPIVFTWVRKEPI